MMYTNICDLCARVRAELHAHHHNFHHHKSQAQLVKKAVEDKKKAEAKKQDTKVETSPPEKPIVPKLDVSAASTKTPPTPTRPPKQHIPEQAAVQPDTSHQKETPLVTAGKPAVSDDEDDLYWKAYGAGIVFVVLSLTFQGCLLYTCQVASLAPSTDMFASSCWFVQVCMPLTALALRCSLAFRISALLCGHEATPKVAFIWAPSTRPGSVKMPVSGKSSLYFLLLLDGYPLITP